MGVNLFHSVKSVPLDYDDIEVRLGDCFHRHVEGIYIFEIIVVDSPENLRRSFRLHWW